MKKPLTKRLTRSPIWIILGVGLLVVAGLLLVVALLSPGPAAPAPTPTASSDPTATTAPTMAAADDATAEPEPAPTSVPPAATVNGYTITQSYLSRTVRLNQVLGELSGASTLGKKDTLERLIRSQLILQGVTAVDEPTEEEVESFIGALQENWGVSDQTMAERLEAKELDRDFLVDTIDRLLTVQASVESLEADGHNVSEWLREEEKNAEIMIYEDLAREEAEPSPTAEPTDQAELLTSTPVPKPEVPDVAPNFTLDRAGGGTLTLNDQLEEGPVVLVFFEKCG